MDAKKILTNKSFCVLPWTGFELEPENILSQLKNKFINQLATSNHYLKNSYENILKYISNTPWNKDISNFQEQIEILDTRRNQSAQAVFPELFKELENV